MFKRWKRCKEVHGFLNENSGLKIVSKISKVLKDEVEDMDGMLEDLTNYDPTSIFEVYTTFFSRCGTDFFKI